MCVCMCASLHFKMGFPWCAPAPCPRSGKSLPYCGTFYFLPFLLQSLEGFFSSLLYLLPQVPCFFPCCRPFLLCARLWYISCPPVGVRSVRQRYGFRNLPQLTGTISYMGCAKVFPFFPRCTIPRSNVDPGPARYHSAGVIFPKGTREKKGKH